MTNDYINRRKICEALYEADAITIKGLQILQHFPAAYVTERNVGKWNVDKDGLTWCCLCGFGKEHSEDRRYKYCPNCGAEM